MDHIELHCSASPQTGQDTVGVTVQTPDRLYIMTNVPSADHLVGGEVVLSKSDANRLADFLTAAGFGSANETQPEPPAYGVARLTEQLISLAGKVAILERRMNSAALEMKG